MTKDETKHDYFCDWRNKHSQSPSFDQLADQLLLLSNLYLRSVMVLLNVARQGEYSNCDGLVRFSSLQGFSGSSLSIKICAASLAVAHCVHEAFSFEQASLDVFPLKQNLRSELGSSAL